MLLVVSLVTSQGIICEASTLITNTLFGRGEGSSQCSRIRKKKMFRSLTESLELIGFDSSRPSDVPGTVAKLRMNRGSEGANNQKQMLSSLEDESTSLRITHLRQNSE